MHDIVVRAGDLKEIYHDGKRGKVEYCSKADAENTHDHGSFGMGMEKMEHQSSNNGSNHHLKDQETNYLCLK